MSDETARAETTNGHLSDMPPERTLVESDYLSRLARDAVRFERLQTRAKRWPHEKLRTAIDAVLRD